MKNILIWLMFTPAFLQAQEVDFSKLVPFYVTSVFDGDGFKGFFNDTTRGEIRIWGADTPERRGYSSRAQPYGNEAGDSLRELIKGRVVYLDTLTMKGKRQTDRWGRTVAVCYLADTTNVNFLIVERGWAWASNVSDSRILNFNAVLRNAQREARAAKRGLWGLKGWKAPAWWRANFSIFK